MRKLLNTLYVTSENSYLTPQGKFLARVTGKVQGNVLLREQQYKSSKDDEISLTIAKNCITGKVYNARWVLV